MKTTRRKLLLVAGAIPAAGAVKDTPSAPAILEVFSKRQTVRRYKSDAVPDEHLRAILDAARRGPTCMNQQPWKFLVVRDPAKIAAMKKQTLDGLTKRFEEFAATNKGKDLTGQKEKALRFTEGYFTAPVYVAVLVDSESSCAAYAAKHDGPIAAAYLMLAARAFGYGTAYLTDGIPESVTREVLRIPSRYQRVCITPIGIPDGWPEPAQKRKLDEIVVYESFDGHAPNQPIPYNP